MVRLLLFVMSLWGCSTPLTEGDPRAVYNQGAQALSQGDYDGAIALLQQAREQAGTDGELRHQAAYNLALAYSQKAGALENCADELQGEVTQLPESCVGLVTPISAGGTDTGSAAVEWPGQRNVWEQALSNYNQSTAWFQDALRIEPNDEDARTNLEIAYKRRLQVSDQLNAGQDGIESRLDSLLESTRAHRDLTRQLATQVDATGDSVEPSSYRRDFDSMAIQARTLKADASIILGLATDEIMVLEALVEEQRSPEQQMRLGQLTQLERHLNRGRDDLAHSRRSLNDLDINPALNRIEDAVRYISRAREQLFDPLTVLQNLAAEQSQLMQQTVGLSRARSAEMVDEAQGVRVPGWLNGPFLSRFQNGIEERTTEMYLRFAATGEQTLEAEASLQEQMQLSQIQSATPLLQTASEQMAWVETALDEERWESALPAETEALNALSQAIERFADVKTLINLAHQLQVEMVEVLSPSEEPDSESSAERAQWLRESLVQNQDRMQRLEALLPLDQQQRMSEMQQAGEGSTEEQMAQLAERYGQAERYRQAAVQALIDMEQALRMSSSTSVVEESLPSALSSQSQMVEPLQPALAALEAINQLRLLFLEHIIEYLEELYHNQSKTRDETAALEDEPYENLHGQLAVQQGQQGRHQELAQSLIEALQARADAAAQQEPSGTGPDFEGAYSAMSEADEMMSESLRLMQEVQEGAGGMSHSLEPTLEAQQEVLDSIQEAIQALQPPPPPEEQDSEDNQDSQDSQGGQPEAEEMSPQEAQRRLQAAREREAERERQSAEAAVSSESVEKDW